MMLALTSHYTATNAKHHRYAATSLRTVPGAGGWRSRRGGASAWVGAGAVRALGSGPGRCERLGRGRGGGSGGVGAGAGGCERWGRGRGGASAWVGAGPVRSARIRSAAGIGRLGRDWLRGDGRRGTGTGGGSLGEPPKPAGQGTGLGREPRSRDTSINGWLRSYPGARRAAVSRSRQCATSVG